MNYLRPMQGVSIVQRGLRNGRPAPSVCLAQVGVSSSAAGVSRCFRTQGRAAANRNEHHGWRVGLWSASAAELEGRRCSSSRSGAVRAGRRPTDKQQRSTAGAKNAEDKKSAYTFLDKDELGRLQSKSKQQNHTQDEPKSDTGTAKAAADGVGEEKEADSSKLTIWQHWKNARAKMKLLWKQYGLVWLVTYTTLYFGGLGAIYVVFDTGLVAADVDTSANVQMMAEFIGAQDNAGVTWLKNTLEKNPKADNLFKALIVNELLEYPRDIVSIAVTPSIARAVGRVPPKVKS